MTHPGDWTYKFQSALLLALAGSMFGVGRLSKRPQPAEVKTVEKVRTEWRDKVEWRDRLVTVAGKDRVVRKVVHVVEKPDGTKTRDEFIDSSTAERQTTAADHQATREASATQTTERVVHVVSRPRWSASLLGGVSSGVVLGHAPSPFLGAEVSRSVIGPLRLGLVFVKAKHEVPRVGLSLGIAF